MRDDIILIKRCTFIIISTGRDARIKHHEDRMKNRDSSPTPER